jgi:hypothetical protein
VVVQAGANVWFVDVAGLIGLVNRVSKTDSVLVLFVEPRVPSVSSTVLQSISCFLWQSPAVLVNDNEGTFMTHSSSFDRHLPAISQSLDGHISYSLSPTIRPKMSSLGLSYRTRPSRIEQ